MGCCQAKYTTKHTKINAGDLDVAKESEVAAIELPQPAPSTAEGARPRLNVKHSMTTDPNALNITPKSQHPGYDQMEEDEDLFGSEVKKQLSKSVSKGAAGTWNKKELNRMFKKVEDFEEGEGDVDEENDEAEEMLKATKSKAQLSGTKSLGASGNLGGTIGLSTVGALLGEEEPPNFDDEDGEGDDEGGGVDLGGDFLMIQGKSMSINNVEKLREHQLKEALLRKEANRPISMFIPVEGGPTKKKKKRAASVAGGKAAVDESQRAELAARQRRRSEALHKEAHALKKLKESAQPHMGTLSKIQQDRAKSSEVMKINKVVRKCIAAAVQRPDDVVALKRVSKLVGQYLKKAGVGALPEIKVVTK